AHGGFSGDACGTQLRSRLKAISPPTDWLAPAARCCAPRGGPGADWSHRAHTPASGQESPFCAMAPPGGAEHRSLVTAGVTAGTGFTAPAALNARLMRYALHPASLLRLAREWFRTIFATRSAS